MGKMKDLTNLEFGNLRVLHRVEDAKPGRPAWLCQCKCGNTVVVTSQNQWDKILWLLTPNSLSYAHQSNWPSIRKADSSKGNR